MGVAAFLGVVVCLVAAFLADAAGLGGPLVTRPDLVFPSTFSTSMTAGAWWVVSQSVAEPQKEGLQMPVSCAW